MHEFSVRIPELWQSLAQAAVVVPGLLLQILARVPGLLLRTIKSLALALKPNEAKSHRAAIRAILRSDANATFVRVLAYMGALAIMALTGAHFVPSTSALMETEPAPVVEWLHVAKPFPAFSLPMSELAESGYDYAMRRHVSGGGRQDILTWGDIKGGAPHLMVEIYRSGSEFAGFDTAEREIAARLETADISPLKSTGEMETKFGAMSLVEFPLRNPARQCLGFVHAYKNPQLQILGWHCTSGSAPVRDLAACALDRLTLLAAGSEPKLRELFARAELKRNFCGQRSHLLTPTPKLGPAAPRRTS